MAWPSELGAFPADPASLAPQTLRTWYVAMRDAFLSISTELGADPGGRLAALEVLPRSLKTGSYTAALVDANTKVDFNSASTSALTIPLNATVGFPVNTLFVVGRYGTGAVNIAGAGGVTVRAAGGLLGLRAQYSVATVWKLATDEWWAWGDLA